MFDGSWTHKNGSQLIEIDQACSAVQADQLYPDQPNTLRDHNMAPHSLILKASIGNFDTFRDP